MQSVSIIGGYLGAGKTTLINNLLRNAKGARIAVLVNEFGALPIDEDLIEAKDDALISIAGGCVCCSYGSDLVQALLDLSEMDMKPDHFLIESSGVALPGAIAASVSVVDGFQIVGIIVVANAETIKTQASDIYVGDTVERQLADANIVLLNKVDLVSSAQLEDTKNWLSKAAQDAAVVTSRHGDVPNGIVMQEFEYHSQNSDRKIDPHASSFESRVLQFPSICDADTVARFLADPETSLIRAKGFVPTSKGLRTIQTVGHRWTVSDAPDGSKPGIVVIAQKSETCLDHVERKLAAILEREVPIGQSKVRA